MFHSGPWRGWWEQAGYGRQPMEEMQIRFADGAIEGTGWDVIGFFSFLGQYDSSAAVAMVKRYVGQHDVLYEGYSDGEGAITGQWSIGQDFTGRFALSPLVERPAADAPIEEL